MSIVDSSTMTLERVHPFLERVVGDLGAAVSCALVLLGDRLGLYRALAEHGPATSSQLAERTGTHERYVREWLLNQAASGYLDYDSASGAYTLPDAHAAALADADSPFYVAGGFQVVLAMTSAVTRIEQAFVQGHGLLWSEHDANLFEGTERFFRPGYLNHLVREWIPALSGVEEKLQRGARVADVGCGHGTSTIILAQAFPRSTFVGFDNHAASIECARRAAEQAGVSDRVRFESVPAAEIPRDGYDLIAFFDSLHDMGDPVGALHRARQALAHNGTVMLVEPMAGESIEENLNPVARVYSAASTLCCTPNALASGGHALGTLASEATLADVARQAGLGHFRRVAETPFNRIFEAHP